MTALWIGLGFGIGYAFVNRTRFLAPYSLSEMLWWGPPGPYPDGDRLPPPEDDE